jgi:NAD(P)H dehydrogenase (quinone)
MNVLIVHCHPNPKSFNAALTRTAREALEADGHAVAVSDLYAEGFDPVEAPRHYRNRADETTFAPLGEQRHAYKTESLPQDVAREIARLEWADQVILQFPLWWHAQPAMLKGWYDRVFVSGGLYTSKMRYDAGYFRGKRAMLSITSGAPAVSFGPGARGGDLEVLLWPIQYSLYYMGFAVLPPFVSTGIQGHGFAYRDADSLDRHLEATLTDWARRVRRLADDAPLTFPGWADWDENGAPRAS